MGHSNQSTIAIKPGKRENTLPAPNRSRLGLIFGAVVHFVFVFGAFLSVVAFVHPDSKLPNEWNPLRPLAVADKVTPLTSLKLSWVLDDPALCKAALADAAEMFALDPIPHANPDCGIAAPVKLVSVGQAALSVDQTSCAVALRTAMWERHGIQPLAQDILGTAVTQIDDIGSYNCREMRTSSGRTDRMSTHATAEAIDISGFRFADGTRASLIADWDDPGPKGAFLRAARDSACDWFRVTLSPDYNQLHADHFHLQSTGWGLCR